MTLLSQANCYACYGIWGTWKILEAALFAQWAALVEVTNPNLIPPGSMYNNAGNGPLLTLVSGQTYHLTLVAPATGNDLACSYTNGTTNTQVNAPVTNLVITPLTFQGVCQINFYSGVMNSLVTAILRTP